jgi:hypothetical protein
MLIQQELKWMPRNGAGKDASKSIISRGLLTQKVPLFSGGCRKPFQGFLQIGHLVLIQSLHENRNHGLRSAKHNYIVQKSEMKTEDVLCNHDIVVRIYYPQ